MHRLTKIFLNSIFLLLIQTTAYSGNCTGTLTVSAKVAPVCVIQSSTLTLQTPNPKKSTEVVGVCCFDVVCTNGANASISLNKGEHSAYSGTTTRAMHCDKNYISYDLYSDEACKNIWDENYPVVYSSKSGLPFSMKIYAKAYIESDLHPGVYKDKVVIRPSCPDAIITPGILDVTLIVP